MDKLNVLKSAETGMKTAAESRLDDGAEAWLSALFDGELETDEADRALGRLGRDAAASRVWAEYSLIGDAMRGCGHDSASLGARCRAALASEPTILAPVSAAKGRRQPYYWLAAAAAVTAITWSVWQVAPNPGPDLPATAGTALPGAVPAGAVLAANELMPSHVMPYLAAHQDFAYAVVSEPEMRFTQVSLQGDGR